ncbi:MAG: tripartite tricarboxylate transporter TctB family protein, partial [Alphaproteobacteria bacterium]|nr:tripartite tricarboxylate transporter TctB family protein [Alphaproteobacteria bacterium]
RAVSSGTSAFMKFWGDDVLKQSAIGLGLIYLTLGALGLAIGLGYPMGSVARMGPGFLPIVVSSLLLAFAAISIFKGLAAGRPQLPSVQLLAKGAAPVMTVVISVVTFAAVCRVLGLFPSTLLLILMSATASPEFALKPKPIAGAVIVAGTFSYIFVKLLGLPLPYINMPG